jgi:hypothetical protein
VSGFAVFPVSLGYHPHEHSPMNRYACLLLCAFAMSANAAGWVPAERIDPPCCFSTSTTDMHFGSAVAVDLSPGFPQQVRALYVGAPNFGITSDNVAYPEAGIVFVFVPVNGSLQLLTYLQPFPPQAFAHFGAAVAVNNGVVMIGEPDYDNQTQVNVGKITVNYDRNRNSPSYMPPAFNGLTGMDGTVANARLGASVAISGDGYQTGGGENWLVGGAPGAGAGCAFLHHTGPTEDIDRGSVCGTSPGDAFGSSVGVYSFGAENMLMVAGAPGENILTGAAHVYILSGGNLALLTNLQANNPGQFDYFGTNVSIDSQRIYVGGTGRDKSGVGRTGSVTLFNPGGVNHYTFDTEVFPTSNANPGDLCGATVYPNAIGTGFAMGCPGSDAQANGEGFARVVRPVSILGGTIWLDQILQMGSRPHGVDDLGRDVAMVGDQVFAGAPLADDLLGADNGALQVFGPDQLFTDGFDD